MPDPPIDNLDPWQWAALVVGFAFVLVVITDVMVRLWRVPPAPEPPPPLYDWALDGGLLDVWARDAEGELLAVFPASWLHR